MFRHLIDPGGGLDRFTRRVAFIGFLGLIFVAIVTIADVLLRSLFSAPIDGFEEVSELMFASIIAACLPAGLVQGHNIAIRFLGSALGKGPTRWLELFGALLTLVFFTAIGWTFLFFAIDESTHGRYTQTLEMPTGPWWWAAWAIIIICIPIQIAVFLVRGRQALLGEDAPKGEESHGV